MPDCLRLFAILKKQSCIIENRTMQPGRGFVCYPAKHSHAPDVSGFLALFAVQSFQTPSRNKKRVSIRGCLLCLETCNTALFAIHGFNRRLFAVLKTGVLAPNQLYLSRPFSPYAIRGKCAHLTRSTKLGTIAGAWI